MTLDQRPPALAQRYSLRDRLDRGTDEEIWRAHDDVLGREVAVSFVDAGNGAHTSSAAERDLIAAARLSDASVERILDAGTEGDTGRLFVVTEFVPGETLRAVLDREGPLPPGRAASVVASVLTALECGHRLGVAHGRVAPEQVILGTDGRFRLAGFGRPSGSRATPDGDVRAAAALLFEALTGSPPPPGVASPSARALRAGIPRDLDEAIRRVLSSTADATPPAEEFRTALQRFAAAPSREDRDVAVAEKPPSFFRSWMLVPILLIVGVGIAIGIGLALGRLEVGGPLGIEPKAGGASATPSRATERFQIRSVRAYDPYGDGSEDDSETSLAADGDPATYWHTENYFDGTLVDKPGVGLLFDLGSDRDVSQVRVLTPVNGFRYDIGIGDSAAAARQAVTGPYVAGRTDRVSVNGTGRYVLVWCTSVVPTGDGNRAAISEVEVAGPR
ncbi:MAG: hypothetical protein ACJ76P_01840 [Actinomycetota bacterium]